MEKFKPEGSIFRNFHDQRQVRFEEHLDTVNKAISKIPSGDRVVIVVSKDQFGKVQIPLDLMAEEMIS